jgi:aspartokinase/homoserine dehydrogenase 1
MKETLKALNTLHERFFEDNTKQLNLFCHGRWKREKNSLTKSTNKRNFLRQPKNKPESHDSQFRKMLF